MIRFTTTTLKANETFRLHVTAAGETVYMPVVMSASKAQTSALQGGWNCQETVNRLRALNTRINGSWVIDESEELVRA